MPAKIVPLHDIPVAEEVIAYDSELIRLGKKAAYNDAITVLSLAMPKPPPAWAIAYLRYILQKHLEA